MARKAKRQKVMDLKVAPGQVDNVTEQASSWHELDPDGDVVLILISSSSKNEDPLPKDTDKPAIGEIVAAEPAVEDLTVGDSMLAVEADAEDPYEIFHVSFKEGQELSSQGHTDLPLPDDDHAALLILLNLIHGQIRKVPRTVDLGMLTNLAILVDKYELLEATEMVMDHWIQGLESDIPLSFTNDLLPWICISWVFRKPEIFSKITRVAQLESEGLLEANQLPIPQSVLGIFLTIAEQWDTDISNR
ncbi:MAG: hypothetical protein Q9172_005138 [Xanthocarpia lactea]